MDFSDENRLANVVRTKFSSTARGDLRGSDDDVIPTQPDDAHQIALELMKKLITLASGVVALSATFLEKMEADFFHIALLGSSWIALVVSIFCGLQTISAIVKSRLTPEHQ